MLDLENAFREVKEQFIDACIGCGECISGCPYVALGPLNGCDPSALSVERVEMLAHGACTDQAYRFVRGCLLCGECASSCPVGLDPYLINVVSRNALANGDGHVAQRYARDTVHLAPMLPENRLNRFKLLHSLQVNDKEVAWLADVPKAPPAVDAVLFLSCALFSRADRIFTLLDIMRRLGDDFLTLGGVDFCCGFINFLAGRQTESRQNLEKIAAAVEACRAKTLIVNCATCYRWFRELSKRMTLPFDIIHIFQHIDNHMDRLAPAGLDDARVAIHEACHFGRQSGEKEVLRRIAGSIPGVKLADLEPLDPRARCCGASASGFLPEIAARIRNERLEEACNAHLDILLTPCEGCSSFLNAGSAGSGITISPLETLLGASLGIHHKDRLKKIASCATAESALSLARGNLWENQFKADEVRPIVAGIFNIPEE